MDVRAVSAVLPLHFFTGADLLLKRERGAQNKQTKGLPVEVMKAKQNDERAEISPRVPLVAVRVSLLLLQLHANGKAKRRAQRNDNKAMSTETPLYTQQRQRKPRALGTVCIQELQTHRDA